MNKLSRGRIRPPFASLLGRLFHPRISELRCVSVSANRSLSLRRQFLSSAGEIQLSFSIRWPLFSFFDPRRSSVRIRLFSPAGLKLEEVLVEGPKPAPKETAPNRDGSWRIQQSNSGRASRVRVQLPRRLLAALRQALLEFCEGRSGARLQRLCLQAVDEPTAQRLRLEGVRAEGRRLWTQSGNRWHLGDAIPQSADFLVPEFTIPATELAAALPKLETWLETALKFGGGWTALGRSPVVLDRGSIRVLVPALPLTNRDLFPRPGPYRLRVCIQGRVVAEFGFRILDQKSWLRQMKVGAIEVFAETLHGRLEKQVGALRWDKHVAFCASARIQMDIPAPNTLLRCTGQVLQGDAVLQREDFLFRPSAGCKVRFRRFDLSALGEAAREKHTRLRLSMSLENEEKASWPIIILPRRPFTDFEGRLRADPRYEPADEQAYMEILKGLRGPEDAPPSARSHFPRLALWPAREPASRSTRFEPRQ